jgi:hypothetical protein
MTIKFNQLHQGKRNIDGRLGGILIEAKDSQMYRDIFQMEIGSTVLKVLRKYGLDNIKNATKYCPIYLHSFDFETVKYWSRNTELPVNYLIEGDAPFNLK